MSEAQGGSTLLTEAAAAGSGNPAPLQQAPSGGAEQAIHDAQNGPPEYIPAKFWDAEKKLPKIEDMGRGYSALEKLLGREKVPVPTGDDDEEGWQRWYAASRPETPDAYEFERPTLPEGLPYDEEGEKFLRQWAHQNGLSKRQTKSLYQDYAKMQTERHVAWHKHLQDSKAETVSALHREYGAQYDAAVSNAGSVMRQYGDPDSMKFLDESGLGNDPRLIRIFARIGKDMAGETRLKGQPTQQAEPADIQRAIAEHREKYGKVLTDSSHPDHGLRLKGLTDLFKKLHPE